ncbi:MAG: CHAT domain-containing protein, partial [Nitrososphaera sp.]
MPIGLDLPSILALIPKNGALIATLITSQGSAVFVISHGVKTVDSNHVILFNDFTDSRLNALIAGSDNSPGWLRSYVNFRSSGTKIALEEWQEAINTFSKQLWEILMQSIHERLRSLGLNEGAPVMFLPQGRLSLLPLHAACHEVNGIMRTFLDEYTVSYAPSAYALSVCYRRLQEECRHKPKLLAVLNPTIDLPFTEIEGETVATFFTPTALRKLEGVEATQEAILKEASEYSYLHFACHGYYDPQDVMQSGVLLAGDQLFNVSEIISKLKLNVARLVTLSACETGLTEFRESPDEFIGLPSGFLEAGSPGVVSSLWGVSDCATSLLMAHFYYEHLKKGLHPSVALR